MWQTFYVHSANVLADTHHCEIHVLQCVSRYAAAIGMECGIWRWHVLYALSPKAKLHWLDICKRQWSIIPSIVYKQFCNYQIWATFWPLKCLFPSNWCDQLTWASCRDDSWPSPYPPLTRVRQKWSAQILPPIRCYKPCLASHLLSLCLCAFTA